VRKQQQQQHNVMKYRRKKQEKKGVNPCNQTAIIRLNISISKKNNKLKINKK